MNFEIAAIACRVAGERRRTIRIAAEADQRIAKRDAILIPAVEPGRIEAAGEGLGRGEIGREAHILLIAESHDLDGTCGLDALPRQSLDRDDAEHHAEIAVVAAGIDDGIDMRADEEGGCVGIGAFDAADHGAERVDMGV